MTTIMITGATDGIGLATAQELAEQGHDLVLHGRNAEKLRAARQAVEGTRAGSVVGTLLADLADLAQVAGLGTDAQDLGVEVLVNNAGVLTTDRPITDDGLDVRFVVNTIAPYLLTRRLLPSLPRRGRVVNLSSAAQAPVDLEALGGGRRLDDRAAYAQSKLAITMWTRHLAQELGPDGPVVVAVNPGSLLATKMVQDGFGIEGNDVGIGVGVLVRAATGDDFADASGMYYDNDAHRFADPHPSGMDDHRTTAVVAAIEAIISR